MRNPQKQWGSLISVFLLCFTACLLIGCGSETGEKVDMSPKGTPYPGMQGAKMTVPPRSNK